MDRVVIFYARLRANDPKAILAYRRLKGLAPTDPRCAAILAKLRRLAAASMAQMSTGAEPAHLLATAHPAQLLAANHPALQTHAQARCGQHGANVDGCSKPSGAANTRTDGALERARNGACSAARTLAYGRTIYGSSTRMAPRGSPGFPSRARPPGRLSPRPSSGVRRSACCAPRTSPRWLPCVMGIRPQPLLSSRYRLDVGLVRLASPGLARLGLARWLGLGVGLSRHPCDRRE